LVRMALHRSRRIIVVEPLKSYERLVYTLRPVQRLSDLGNDISIKEQRVPSDYLDDQVRISESSNSLTYIACGASSNDGRSLQWPMGRPSTVRPTVRPLLWIGLIKWRNSGFRK